MESNDGGQAGRRKTRQTSSLTNAIDEPELQQIWDLTGIFPNDAAIVRLVGALLLEQNDEWQLQRRYMQLEGLSAVSDNQPAKLSAVING
ncbi:hypothetical protein WPS_35670 [Vulcanimicrobium alpinum]|uniref:Transposase n=1 Tax=Vulcanimicrobium alpinum TaxID=3016050 RepID=A0AAN2CBI4_UNVUL|nr:transposase [Vulcanimicrobium alpinum]BDE08291.1 hypothetical protein WPS_35670 [Vulcanimicrobium alpinum]